MNYESVAKLRSHGDIWAADHRQLSAWLSRSAASTQPAVPRADGPVEIIPVQGPITKRGGFFSGGTDEVRREFDNAMASPSVSGILLDIDSPGGSAAGLSEFADHIFDSRGDKPIVAVSNPHALSAAFWIATAADKLFVSPSGEVGSVGVWSLHLDFSSLLESEGIKPTFISAGRFKTEGNPFEPLTDEAREEMQASVDEVHSSFIEALARNRDVSRMHVAAEFGEGRSVRPGDSLKAGMVDGIASIHDVLRGMGAGRGTDGDRARRERTRSRR